MGSPVLIVEDDPSIRGLLEAVLLHESIECEYAPDGRVAIEKLRRVRFAAILLDLLLPNVNGFELLRALAVTDPDLLRKTIVITAANESTWRGCEEIRSVRCVMTKPIEIFELIKVIRACLDVPPGTPPQPAITPAANRITEKNG
jgi:DNA-binding response OmpR family regulator